MHAQVSVFCIREFFLQRGCNNRSRQMVEEHLKTCLSFFLKNFCMSFVLCLDRFAPSPSAIVFHITHYLRLDSTEFFLTIISGQGLSIAAVCSVFIGHISVVLDCML